MLKTEWWALVIIVLSLSLPTNTCCKLACASSSITSMQSNLPAFSFVEQIQKAPIAMLDIYDSPLNQSPTESHCNAHKKETYSLGSHVIVT